jgi:integrase
MESPELAQVIPRNPVKLARPKAPKAYQTESTQALDNDEVRALVRVVKEKAGSGSVVGKRDLAMLLFYLLTGMGRREVAQLRWGDVRINGSS